MAHGDGDALQRLSKEQAGPRQEQDTEAQDARRFTCFVLSCFSHACGVLRVSK